MPLEAAFRFARTGNTVPYPPSSEDGRTNAGFVDLRGSPQRVDDIHEVKRSPALAQFLRTMAGVDEWISLGCDLGDRVESARESFFAGGYVQFTSSDFFVGYDFYERHAEWLREQLAKSATEEDWWLSFEISDVSYKDVGAGTLPRFACGSKPRRAH